MTILVNHFPVNITGSQDFGPQNFADSIKTATLRLARNTTATPTFWPNRATTVDAQIAVSLDAGASFQFVGAFGVGGGIVTRGDGTQAPESSATWNCPSGINRQVKATVTVANGPLVSQLTLEVN